MSTAEKKFGSFSGEHGGMTDGLKDISHQDGSEYKPEQVAEAYSEGMEVAILDVALQVGADFGDRDVVALCPGCYTGLRLFDGGLPERLVEFDEDCNDCGASVMRHEAVVTPWSRIGDHDEDELKAWLGKWFRAYHLFGPSRGVVYFRNWEMQDKWWQRVHQWGLDANPECAVCSRSMSGERLDCDHHHRRSDRVLLVCRECHAFGHNTPNTGSIDGGSAGDVQDAKAQRLGLRRGVDLKLWRYVKKYLEQTPADVLESRYAEDGGKWRHIAWRLNAYSWEHGTDLDARASELKEVFETVERNFEDWFETLVVANTGRPHW